MTMTMPEKYDKRAKDIDSLVCVGLDADYLISSADMMQRNLDRRVEVAVPVRDSALRDRLDEVLDLSLADDVLAWQFDGHHWKRVPTRSGVNAQSGLAEGAIRRNRGLA